MSPIVTPSPDSSGGGSAHGMSVYLSVNTNVVNNTNIPFDTVDLDTDGFWDAVTKTAVIPAGLGGLYQASLYAVITNANGVTHAQVNIENNAPNASYVEGPLVDDTFDEFAGSCSLAMHLPEGTTVFPVLTIQGGTPAVVEGGEAANCFTLAYLGALV